MRRFAQASLTFLTLTLAGVSAHAELSQATGAAVAFLATGPGGLKIEGKTSELAVAEKDGAVRVIVALANLDTGIALRNRHMREKYLEVQKYPNAELVVDRAALKLPAGGGDVTGTAPGKMTIHGQTRPVTVAYQAKFAGGQYTVSGSTHVDMKEHGIEVPSYLGVTVKPGVDITVRFGVTDR